MARKKSLFGGGRRKTRYKSFFGMLLAGQRKTERGNCPGSKRKK